LLLTLNTQVISPEQLSFTEYSMITSLILRVTGDSNIGFADMLVIAGPCESWIVTTKDELEPVSLAHTTTVSPIEKKLPDGGVQLTDPQLAEVDGAG